MAGSKPLMRNPKRERKCNSLPPMKERKNLTFSDQFDIMVTVRVREGSKIKYLSYLTTTLQPLPKKGLKVINMV